MIEPSAIGVTAYDQDAVEVIITIGFAPAGGCVTRNAAIAAIANPTAMPVLHHCSGSAHMVSRPHAVETICPPMTLIGWDSGASGIVNTKTQEAPKVAASSGVCHISVLRASSEMVIAPPSPAKATLCQGMVGCRRISSSLRAITPPSVCTEWYKSNRFVLFGTLGGWFFRLWTGLIDLAV